MTLPTADWLAALAEMDTAVSTALAELDAFEARWPEPTRPEPPRTDVEERLAGWDARLLAAGRLAEGLERDFTACAAAVMRWGAAFTDWRGRIQQQPT